MVPTLLSSVHNPLYQRHEFEQVKKQVVDSISSPPPETAVFDALHRVAFRGGLANNVGSGKELVGNVKRSDMEAWAKSVTGSGSNIAIVATGVNHADLEGLVDAILSKVPSGSGSPIADKSVYRGGEVRIDANGPSHFIIAGEGVGFTSADYPAALVLKGLIGGAHPAVKWGSANNPAGKASAKDVKVGAFNFSYSDTGLFGMHAVGSANGIKGAMEKSVQALKSAAGGISAQDLERGKKAALVAIEGHGHDGNVAQLAQQALATGNVLSFGEFGSKISSVTADQVAKVCVSGLELNL